MLTHLLRREGHEVARHRLRTLIRGWAVEAPYCKPNTNEHNVWRKICAVPTAKIDRANQVFALFRTYIPRERGFVYLTALVDRASRKILAHRVAITPEACPAVEALEAGSSDTGCRTS